MDSNLLKNLGLDGKMNQNDINLLNQILNSTVGNNKTPKMTAKDRNNLINKLSGNSSLSNIPEKEIKDMNDEEKKIYREELKKKLKNKQNEKKMLRTNNLSKNKSVYNDAISKISDMMKNLPNDALTNINTNVNINESNINESNMNQSESNKINNTDKINYIINKNYNDKVSETTNLDQQVEDLNDYLN